MVSLTIGVLVLCLCGPLLVPINAIPIQEEDDDNERSFKRELELFDNEVQDEWEHDDNEYLSRQELQEAYKRENGNEIDVSNEDDKRWLDVDTPHNGVSKEQLSPAYDDELPKNGELFQDDIVMDDYVRDVFNGEAQKRDAVSLKSYRWPNCILPYMFDPDINPASKLVIKHAMKEYHKYTCVQFVKKKPGDLNEDYINFISNGSACYSNVGRRGGRQAVSIGSGCYRVGTPIHEIMHVIGFFHEMARPDRDEAVEIHWENIKERLKHNFRKIPESLDKNYIPYDFNSVMEYSDVAFSKNGAATITSIKDPKRQFGQRCGFSVGDIKEVNMLCNCPRYNERFKDDDNEKTLC